MTYAERLRKRVRRYAVTDAASLDAFQREHFGQDARQVDPGYRRWLFDDNPHRSPQGPTLWLFEREGVVLGQQAGISVPLHAAGHAFSGSWAVDLMVAPQWRMRGVGPALCDAQTASCDIAMALGVSEEAYQAYLSGGWTDMGKLPFFVRPLDAARLLQGQGAPRWFRDLVGATSRPAVGGSAWAASRILEVVTGAQLEPIEAFDATVDGLWMEASHDYSLLARRDFETLRWRFDAIKGSDRYRRYYLTRHGHLMGYIVTRYEQWHGQRVGRIVDHLSPLKWTAPLFAEAVERLHQEGVAAVFYEGFDRAAEGALRALGFLKGPPRTRFLYKAQDNLPLRAAWLAQPQNWFVTDADADRDV